jgi:hypothetical protein
MSVSIEISTTRGLVKVDLDLIKKADARLVEIASATPNQALELIAFFTDSLSKLIDNIFDVRLALSRAETETERQRSLVTLSEEGKKAGNAEARKALVSMNPEFLAAKDKQDQLEAVLEFLKEKKEVLSKGYFGAKDIIEVNGGMTLLDRRL